MSDHPSIYSRLGVPTVINGLGTYTTLGGSLMPPEVVQAMAEAAGWFVSIPELQEKVGARIADRVGVPAAMVTAGAASAIAMATAGCMTLGHPKALARLPGTEGLRNEVVLQRTHESGYEPQILSTGARLVWVETRADLDQTVGPRTAMLFFLNRADPLGRIGRAEWLHVARERGVPALLDAAADIPPVSRLSAYVREGFDLVAFSGGKALRGPQASGLLLGRPDLIAASRAAISPHMGIGRGMKVGKEEIVGLLAAVERYLDLDHKAEWHAWEARAAVMIDRLAEVPDLDARRDVPAIANHAPSVVIEWSRRDPALTAEEVVRQLWNGEPRIAALAEGPHSLRIAIWTLRGDEHHVVTDRIREIFGG